jgi:imidazolonepropionase-like amidohydrolase
MLIVNANIKTMEDHDVEHGFLYLKNGKIEQIGQMQDLTIQDTEVLDVHGAMVLPGLIDAHCHIGMWEDGLGFEGEDGNEETDPVTPQLSAVDAVNPMDRCFQEALEAGVTTVLTGPGSANPISGSWCAMKTFGRRIDDMLLSEKIGMKFALGENPKNVYSGKGQTPMTRMGTAALIREELMKAKRYMQDMKRAKKEEDFDPPEYDAKCEALIPVLKGKMKAFFHAHRADDVFTAIRIAKEFNLSYVVIHGTEGHKVADLLQEEQADVIVGPVICDRSKPELREMTAKNAAVLTAHGVRTAICTDHPELPIQYLPLSAGICVRNGLEYEQALKMLTIIPARICGIDKRVGSIRKGKDADLVVVSGDILDVYTIPDYVIVNGKILVDHKSK